MFLFLFFLTSIMFLTNYIFSHLPLKIVFGSYPFVFLSISLIISISILIVFSLFTINSFYNEVRERELKRGIKLDERDENESEMRGSKLPKIGIGKISSLNTSKKQKWFSLGLIMFE